MNLEGRRTNSGHRITFNPEWTEKRPWLVCKEEISNDGHSYSVMFCELCQKWNTKGANGSMVWNTIGCSSLRLDVVVKHEQSIMHKQAVSNELRTEADIDSAFEKMNENEFASLLDAQTVLYFLIKHNLPIHTLFKPLIELCIGLGATNLPHLFKGKNASYTSHRTVDEFLDCQAKVVQDKVEEKVNEGGVYGMMIDEYTDVSARKHLAMVTRYIDQGSAKIAFLQDIQLPNGSADTIFSSMKGFLSEQTSIPLTNMTSFASDGPSVMVGKKNGVVALLKREHPSIIDIHCMNHRLQLAVSKAFHNAKAADRIDELLTGVFKYYHYSTVKSGSLDAMQTVLREMDQSETSVNLSVKKAVHTRWLSHEKALQTVRKLYVAICKDLENAVAEGRDKKLRDGCGIPASSLLKLMKSYNSIYFIHLLCDVCTSLSSLTRLFERNDVDLSIVEPKVQATMNSLQKMKDRDGPYLAKANVIAEELNITGETDKVKDAKIKFLDELLQQLESRLENTEMINNLAALNLSQVSPDTVTFHGDHEVSQLAELFNLDVDETLFQWNELKEIFKEEMSSCTPGHMLRTLTEKKRTLGDIYPNMVKLLRVHESLIISTAGVERVFSRVKLIVTEHRNRLQVQTTNKLLMVALNTDSEADIDFKQVVKYYLKQKNRRIC